jgi:hypothetical protein
METQTQKQSMLLYATTNSKGFYVNYPLTSLDILIHNQCDDQTFNSIFNHAFNNMKQENNTVKLLDLQEGLLNIKNGLRSDGTKITIFSISNENWNNMKQMADDTYFIINNKICALENK